ncbi:MAG: hypothetical protein WB630_07610 [Candidatus Acidiferrales bacterium]
MRSSLRNSNIFREVVCAHFLPANGPLPPRTANPRRGFVRAFVFFVFLAPTFIGCRAKPPDLAPAIEFSKIPPAAEGGRERVDTISGRVTGARLGQQIVVYARSGPWWVQPWPDRSLIPIQADSTWSTTTHLGFEYAALLVDPEYHPPPTMDLAPTAFGSVVAVKIVKGVGPVQVARTVPLRFSGYDWQVRTIAGDIGGINNLFDPDNAWVDRSGALHMRIRKKDGRWSCAHLTLSRSLGYGTYNILVRDTNHLEPAAILSMTTYDDWANDQHYREMDIEMGRWGDAGNRTNAQYAIQPFYVPGNVAPFRVPPGTLLHSLHWESGRASFQTVQGSAPRSGANAVSEHVFTAGVPEPGQERFLLMFYDVASDKTPLRRGSEVVIEKFEYLP